MEKRIVIKFETGNDCFQGDFEIMATVQKAIVRYFENGTAVIKDINGNTVGSVTNE